MTSTRSSTKTRVAAAAACAVAAAAGLVGTAAPAVAAGTATAVYNCSYTDPNPPYGTITYAGINTVWQHSTGSTLTIKTNVAAPTPIAAGSLSLTVNGVTLTNNVPDPVHFGPALVPGLVFAPNPLIVHYIPTGLTITCVLVSSSGFPI